MKRVTGFFDPAVAAQVASDALLTDEEFVAKYSQDSHIRPNPNSSRCERCGITLQISEDLARWGLATPEQLRSCEFYLKIRDEFDVAQHTVFVTANPRVSAYIAGARDSSDMAFI